jgi:hypothetical protein
MQLFEIPGYDTKTHPALGERSRKIFIDEKMLTTDTSGKTRVPFVLYNESVVNLGLFTPYKHLRTEGDVYHYTFIYYCYFLCDFFDKKNLKRSFHNATYIVYDKAFIIKRFEQKEHRQVSTGEKYSLMYASSADNPFDILDEGYYHPHHQLYGEAVPFPKPNVYSPEEGYIRFDGDISEISIISGDKRLAKVFDEDKSGNDYPDHRFFVDDPQLYYRYKYNVLNTPGIDNVDVPAIDLTKDEIVTAVAKSQMPSYYGKARELIDDYTRVYFIGNTYGRQQHMTVDSRMINLTIYITPFISLLNSIEIDEISMVVRPKNKTFNILKMKTSQCNDLLVKTSVMQMSDIYDKTCHFLEDYEHQEVIKRDFVVYVARNKYLMRLKVVDRVSNTVFYQSVEDLYKVDYTSKYGEIHSVCI